MNTYIIEQSLVFAHQIIQAMQQILQTNEYYSRQSIRNNRILAGTIFFFQVAMITLYAFFVMPTPTPPNEYDQDLLVTAGVAILVLIGFGLVFSIGKNKIWSSLGFTLFITALTFQLYFLVSGLWTNVNIFGADKALNQGDKLPAYLTNSNNLNVKTYQITAVHAYRCALANSIAFAAFGGRAGPLQAIIITIVGTFLYQLNRQIVRNYSLDFGGSMTIFCFGGFFGSAISLILYCCKQKQSFYQHQLRKSSKFSYMFASIGALFCWVFFPFLNIDIPISLVYNYSSAINTFYSISACVMTSVSLSCIINGKLDLKHIVFSPVVGGVAIGSSAAFISNNFDSMLVGVGAAVLLVCLLGLDRQIRWKVVVENYVLYLYGVVGAAGGLVSAIFTEESKNESKFASLPLGFVLQSASNQLIGVGISAGIGICGGILVGLLLCLVSVQTKGDHYHDKTYWIMQSDGISSARKIQEKEVEAVEKESSAETVYIRQIMIKQPRSTITNPYAFL